MIIVTRTNGTTFALNPDLLERAESTPDTIVTLVDGTRLLVRESVHELVELVRDFRASVIARANDVATAATTSRPLHAVPHPGRER